MVSAITLCAFLSNTLFLDIGWARETASPPAIQEFNLDTFALPLSLGHVKDTYKANNSKKTVIHIQDAHCNYYAQHKITDVIGYLNREYGISTVNLEGGAGDYDISVFTRIQDKAIREKVADYFVKEGLVNGAEYFAINNPNKATLWGIENVKLYLNGLNIYRDTLSHKEAIDKNLKQLNHIISNLKRHIYSSELLEFDEKYTQFKKESLDLKDYIAYLLSLRVPKGHEAISKIYPGKSAILSQNRERSLLEVLS